MGLDINGTKFLLYARKHGVSFETTAMIGRQSMLLDTSTLERNLRLFGNNADASKLLETGYAEPFLTLLGANEITSFDASDYENATVVHDLNTPIPDEYRNRFSAVLDGGTLEHVFNFPVAIKNCMDMVRVGGHFLAIAPANNYFGHGFYQFSPELFYRVLSKANGFELERMMLYEETYENDWYEVADPEAVKERVTLVNSEPSLLLIIARKTADVATLSMPQQSDYARAWESADSRTENAKLSLIARLWKRSHRFFDRSHGMLATRKEHFKKVELP